LLVDLFESKYSQVFCGTQDFNNVQTVAPLCHIPVLYFRTMK